MPEIRVRATVDNADFTRGLQKMKGDAQRLNNELVLQGQKRQAMGFRSLAERGSRVTSLAGSLGALPGGGAAAQIAGTGSQVIWGIQEAAAALGSSLTAAAGFVGVFAASIFSVTTAVNEYRKMVAAQVQEAKSRRRADELVKATVSAYENAMERAVERGAMTRETADAFGMAMLDPKKRGQAMQDIRSMIGGETDTNLLLKIARAAQLEGMPAGMQKELDQSREKFKNEMEKMTESFGDVNKMSAETKSAWEVAIASLKDTQNKTESAIIAEWDAKMAAKPFEKTKNAIMATSQLDSLSKVGLFTASGLNATAALDVQRQQLARLTEISRNTLPREESF